MYFIKYYFHHIVLSIQYIMCAAGVIKKISQIILYVSDCTKAHIMGI